MVDAETLELLQKQQELERIIGLLKQKQSQEQLEKERNAALQAQVQAQAQAKAQAQAQAQAQARQMQIQWLQQLQQLQQLHQIQQSQTQSQTQSPMQTHGQNRGGCEDLTVPLNEQQLRAFLARQLQLQGKCSSVDTNAIVNANINVPAVSVDEDDYPSLEG